jgi:hypothetical protein
MWPGLLGIYVVCAVVLVIALCQAADDDKWGGWRR